MRQFIFIVIALVLGYGLTLFFYTVGGILVQPALFLAKIVAVDRGGDSLLVPFMLINTVLCAGLIYAALWWATERDRGAGYEG